MKELHNVFKGYDPTDEKSLEKALILVQGVPEPWLRFWLEQGNGGGVPPSQVALVQTELARRDQMAAEKLAMRVTKWAALLGICGTLLGAVVGAVLATVL